MVFLGGPIQYAMDNEGQFNINIKNQLMCLIKAIECTGTKVFSAHIEEQFGINTHIQSFDKVCLRDYNWMKQCDVYIAILPNDFMGKLVRTDGTYVEIGWAFALNKPILLICDTLSVSQLSMLVQGIEVVGKLKYVDINKIMEEPQTINELIEYLQNESKLLISGCV